MNQTIQLKKTEIEALKGYEIPENANIQAKFVQLYNGIHGSAAGELYLAKEKFNFMRMLQESPALNECTSLSLYGVFLDVAVNGLSLEGGTKPLAYVISRNANVGTKDSPRWEKRASLVVSPYGELVQRMRAGHIKHADNPVLVYEGDTFVPCIGETGKKTIRYEAKFPRNEGARIVAGFLRITRPDDTIDFEYLTMEDVKRLSGYSAKQNKGSANALYSSNDGQIDPGFFAAKVIKHAFRTYPKVRTGQMTVMESELEKEQNIDYGIDLNDQQQQPADEFTEATDVTNEVLTTSESF